MKKYKVIFTLEGGEIITGTGHANDEQDAETKAYFTFVGKYQNSKIKNIQVIEIFEN